MKFVSFSSALFAMMTKAAPAIFGIGGKLLTSCFSFDSEYARDTDRNKQNTTNNRPSFLRVLHANDVFSIVIGWMP